MDQKKWDALCASIKGENKELSCGLIVDSPWIPGYCGIGNIDFYVNPEKWFECYMKIRTDFPDLMLLPDWWVEYGMATEASSFGCRVEFFDDNLPVAHHIYEDTDDLVERGAPKLPDLRKSGLTPFVLNLQRAVQPKLQEMGDDHRIVCARGPLTIASHLMPVSELMVGVKLEPDAVHDLLKVTTQEVKQWLEVQLENVKNAQGIMVLDDVCGFFGKEDFEEFAEPYLKDIFSSFPEMLHLFHNDHTNNICYPYLEGIGVQAFNPSFKTDIAAMRRQLGPNVCIIGNIPPMALARETPEKVAELTKQTIDAYVQEHGSVTGLILSSGGGAPMGAKQENIDAMIAAVKNA